MISSHRYIENLSATVRTLPTVVEMGIFIFRRDNLSTLKIENHELNFMMPYRKNGKGHANVLRKLERFKIGKRPLVLATPWESHTYREACLPLGVLLLAILVARPAKREKRLWACSTVYLLEHSFPDDGLRMSHPDVLLVCSQV
jgi:hypothetical protein